MMEDKLTPTKFSRKQVPSGSQKTSLNIYQRGNANLSL